MKQARTTGRTLVVLIVAMGLMLFAEIFFLIDIFADFFLIDLLGGWIDHNLVEFAAVALLGLSLVVLSFQIRNLIRVNKAQKLIVQAASGGLMKVIQNRFLDWGLSTSEKEVAWLLIKGLSIQEISDVRETKPGTVKSQTSSIYQKAGLQSRAELVSYFVEDLLQGESLL